MFIIGYHIFAFLDVQPVPLVQVFKYGMFSHNFQLGK